VSFGFIYAPPIDALKAKLAKSEGARIRAPRGAPAESTSQTADLARREQGFRECAGDKHELFGLGDTDALVPRPRPKLDCARCHFAVDGGGAEDGPAASEGQACGADLRGRPVALGKVV
jgi:hypothetical protein